MSEQADAELFPSGAPQALETPLEQYRLLLGTIESLESRRQTLHTFFMSINSLLLAAIGLIANEARETAELGAGVVVLAVAGLVFSRSWRDQLDSYEAVASSKWTVINAFERCLPSSPFCAEYAHLKRKDYRSFTQNEAKIPKAFMGLYLLAVVAGVLLLLGVG